VDPVFVADTQVLEIEVVKGVAEFLEAVRQSHALVLAYEEDRRHDNDGKDPDEKDYDPDPFMSVDRTGLDRLVDYVVAVNTDCSHSHDAHAERDSLDEVGYLAEVLLVLPLSLEEACHLLRNANENDQQVGQGQVGYELVCH